MNPHCPSPRPGATSQTLAAAMPAAGWRNRAMLFGLSALLVGSTWSLARAADPVGRAAQTTLSSSATNKPSPPASEDSDVTDKIDLGNDIKKALRESLPGRKKFTLIISDKPELVPAAAKTAAQRKASTTAAAPDAAPRQAAGLAEPVAPGVVSRPRAAPTRPKTVARQPLPSAPTSRDDIRAKAAALAGRAPDPKPHAIDTDADDQWSYAGSTGPQAWGQLKPEFNVCATGQRQSPINIDDAYTLQGPAEPLLFGYPPSNATVVNTGHTILVNVQGNNTLTVRGATYSLTQLQFHAPSEAQVNSRRFPMTAHLIHKNDQGQLAVVAVLLEPGEANAVIDTLWTYMPLDVNDQVVMPAGLLKLDGLLPEDQRYYQYLGSLTTPPCTEGVLWMVLKTSTQISPAQLRLFQQLYPNNARPLQPVNGRAIRSAQ